MENREVFVQKLVREVFDFAEMNGSKPSKNALAIFLSDKSEEVCKQDRISDKTFTRYYDKYILSKENSVGEPNGSNLNTMAKILGHYDFVAYIKDNTITTEPRFNPKLRSNYAYGFLCAILFLAAVFYFKEEKGKSVKSKPMTLISKPTINPSVAVGSPNMDIDDIRDTMFKPIREGRLKECMYWDGNQFIEMFCDEKLSSEFEMKVGDPILISKFKKITKEDTLTLFSVDKVWYAKDNGELDLFTYHGLHPTTGKTLKPLTEYMLKKYILDPRN